MVFSVLLKYGFQPILMTILKTPRLDNLAQPKYTPEGCSERTAEYPSVDKLAGKIMEMNKLEQENGKRTVPSMK